MEMILMDDMRQSLIDSWWVAYRSYQQECDRGRPQSVTAKRYKNSMDTLAGALGTTNEELISSVGSAPEPSPQRDHSERPEPRRDPHEMSLDDARREDREAWMAEQHMQRIERVIGRQGYYTDTLMKRIWWWIVDSFRWKMGW